MAQIPFVDISYAQAQYNMDLNTDQAIMMKMSGGDNGLYYDDQAARNYNNAVRLGKVPMMYHFYGGGDPVTEANFFIAACSPLALGDIMAVDVERGSTWNPQTDSNAVSKIAAFVNRVHDVTGMWPWVYMNMSTANMYDWSSVFNNCGYWCAAPSYGFNDQLPVKYLQIAQQGPVVNGVDSDMFFGTLAQLKKYGYSSSSPTPTPTPVITTSNITEQKPVGFKTLQVEDPTMAKGETKVVQVGVPGVETVITTVTYTDGVETSRAMVSDTITTQPINAVTDVGTKATVPTPTLNLLAILIRSASTFGITAVTFFITNFTSYTNVAALKILALASIAAGVAAVKNLIRKPQEG